MSDALPYTLETVKLSDLRPHPQNYRQHPPDQIAHLAQSIREHGVYKNIVVARDNTILAGHGMVVACREVGLESAPVKRIDCDPFSRQALKIIVGDNELWRSAADDDRALSEMLKTIAQDGVEQLLGTGYDRQQLSALVMATRTEAEVKDKNAIAEWLGMPEFDMGELPHLLNVQFKNAEDRAVFLEQANVDLKTVKTYKGGKVLSMWWPPRQDEDRSSVLFVEEDVPLPFGDPA